MTEQKRSARAGPTRVKRITPQPDESGPRADRQTGALFAKGGKNTFSQILRPTTVKEEVYRTLREQLLSLLMQQIARSGDPERKKAGNRRLAEAMFEEQEVPQAQRAGQELELDATFSASVNEVYERGSSIWTNSRLVASV